MIARVWLGRAASAADAGAYREHFETVVLRHLRQVDGFRAARLWHREEDAQVELVVVTTWASMEAVRAFAGPDPERAVVEPEARQVLLRFDERCRHYDLAASSAPADREQDRGPEEGRALYLLLYDVVDRFLERRAPFREVHLALAREASERGELLLAGAFDEPVDGAALLFRTGDPSAVERFARADPYVKEGLVRSWRIRKWNVVVGES